MPSQRKLSSKALERAVLDLLAHRGTATACPSEVARALHPEGWRALMEPVRDAVADLQRRGQVDVYQHGRPVRLKDARGPIRLRATGVGAQPQVRQPSRREEIRGRRTPGTAKPP